MLRRTCVDGLTYVNRANYVSWLDMNGNTQMTMRTIITIYIYSITSINTTTPCQSVDAIAAATVQTSAVIVYTLYDSSWS